MPLGFLDCTNTPVSDLSPLKGMPLTTLWCYSTKVSELSPLKGMPLTNLQCYSTKVSELSPLKGMPLKNLKCDFKPERDAEILRSIRRWRRSTTSRRRSSGRMSRCGKPRDDAWLKQVAALPADKQAEAVTAKLKELNPGFDGKATPTFENGVVVGLEFASDEVTDIAPLRALAGLRTLKCDGSAEGRGWLSDLSPLKDMKLTTWTASTQWFPTCRRLRI